MNYNNPELISVLAAEYVLGTLRGKARDRFESIKFDSKEVREQVDYWEAQINPMSLKIAPQTPSKKVWSGIEQRLGIQKNDDNQASNIHDINETKRQPSKNPSATPWQWLSGLAIAASVVLAVLLVRIDIPEVAPVQSVVVFNNEAAETLWSIDITQSDILVKTTQKVPRLPNNDYQLWMVPSSGEAPVSIGLLSQISETRLRKPDIFDRIDIAALAISKEPLGGSPTGAPTEVLYAAEIAIL